MLARNVRAGRALELVVVAGCTRTSSTCHPMSHYESLVHDASLGHLSVFFMLLVIDH